MLQGTCKSGWFSGPRSCTHTGPGVGGAGGGEVMGGAAADSADAPGAELGDSGFAEGGPAGASMLRAGPLPHADHGTSGQGQYA